MELSPEDFKNLAQGIQAILISVVAIIGSAWGILKFKYTREKEKAQHEIDKIKKELQKTQGIKVDIKTEYFKNTNDYDLIVEIELENPRSTMRVVYTDGHPVLLNRLTSNRKGRYDYKEVAKSGIYSAAPEENYDIQWLSSICLLPNTPTIFHVPFKVEEPGIYAVSLVLGSDRPFEEILLSEEDKATNEKSNLHLRKIREDMGQPHSVENYDLIERIVKIE
ncbi:hypothetical protein M3P19_00895 [Muricauda sp. 2012CJ35-5]|uniref:Uncharacterized protein n=1 Tax=Flagellimonas spongiicola TaxID=2942208 RepID=A0ABT0PPD4_9FLAO|nr:hypothetical protein [Allomuricauda spongiicola]MCL6272542.1 hypothetical protein [Allomuricauda spongiicola]